MKTGLILERTGELVAKRISEADSYWTRFVGLLGRHSFLPGEALVLRSTRQVHMFFMRFPIDVIFCRTDGQILHIEESLKPWRVSKFVSEAKYAIELPVGSSQNYGIRTGDRLTFSVQE